MATFLPTPSSILPRSSARPSSAPPCNAGRRRCRSGMGIPVHFRRQPTYRSRTGSGSFVTRAEVEDFTFVVPDDLEVSSLKLKLLDYNAGDAMPMLLSCVEDGQFLHARKLWNKIMNSSLMPTVETISYLMKVYSRMGQFDEVYRIIHDVVIRDSDLAGEVYSSAISCFGDAGQLELMESTIKEMVSLGFKVNSRIGNSFLRYYGNFGTINEIAIAYMRLKKTRILIEEETIRVVVSAYIKEQKYYALGEFLRDVGLGRRDIGNLLWNLLLLSYAVNFKMKSLQREFLRMLDAGFSPDLNTFNIRALAFSKMCMFWDLHLSIEHMNRESILPDLVTYGCIVDAYMERKLGRNLSFALKGMNEEASPIILTDPLVFEAFGKGDFHSCSESLLQSKRKNWTYSKLIKIYNKRIYRSNQVFWNY